MLNFDKAWPKPISVHFLHNWRCAGTSINSLLSSNFHHSYLKIGHPFSNFGWPESYSDHRNPILSIGQIRDRLTSDSLKHAIVGGHTFFGMERFIAGNWDLWMNYRNPINRLNSGILRFYAKKFRQVPGNGNLMDQSSIKGILDLTSPQAVNSLLNTSLLRESNGIARRLASISLTNSFAISADSNVETNDLISKHRFNSKDMYEAACLNLNQIACLISFDYVFESMLSIEKFYNLVSPLINPFSDLRHNPQYLGGVKSSDKRLISNCSDVLFQHTNVDRQLLPLLNQKFSKQINQSCLDTKDVAVRKIIHKTALFNGGWFDSNGTPVDDSILSRMANSLIKRCRQSGELGNDVFETVLAWDCLQDDTKYELRKLKYQHVGRQF